MNIFKTIPIRENGLVPADASWWNTIRTKLIQYAGPAAIGETATTNIENNLDDIPISGFIFDKLEVSYAECFVYFQRKDDSSELRQWGKYAIGFSGTEWGIEAGAQYGHDAGVELSINASTGQVSYSSNEMTGSDYEGSVIFKTTTSVGIAEYF